MVALASLLRERDRRATLYSADLAPRNLRWLPHIKTWTRRLKPEAKYDLTVVVDCGDPKLLGDSFPKPEVTGPVIALDHHRNHRAFGDLFVCDPKAAATGVMVARLADALGWELSSDAALGIWVALVSDTGSFRYSNTNAEALKLAARLVDSHGVTPWDVSERLEERVPLSRYRLLSRVLADLEVTCDGKLAVMTVTAELVAEVKAKWEDTEGLVNHARAIAGVECGVLYTPAKWGGTRVSLRSKGRLIDAGAVCHALGGGGHRGAAGCTIDGDIAKAREIVEAALSAALVAGSDDPKS